jgi:hypothetical protein
MINIVDVRPDMVLAADVKDRHGHVLLREAEIVTEKHVKIFKMWGVTELDVKGVDQEVIEARAAEEFSPELLLAAERVAQERFRHADGDDPVVRELMRLFKHHYLTEHQGEGDHADEPT